MFCELARGEMRESVGIREGDFLFVCSSSYLPRIEKSINNVEKNINKKVSII